MTIKKIRVSADELTLRRILDELGIDYININLFDSLEIRFKATQELLNKEKAKIRDESRKALK